MKSFSANSWLSGFLKETGASLYKMGGSLEGKFYEEAQLSQHKRLVTFDNVKPSIGQHAWIAPNASVIGKVEIGAQSSVWYGSVLRGDVNNIKIGKKTNIQDRCVVHVASGDLEHNTKPPLPTIIGNNVTVEAGSIIHACVLEDGSKIEIGSKILDGAKVGANSIVSAGSLVTAGQVIPSGELWSGTPAKFVRKLTQQEIEALSKRAEDIYALAKKHDEEHSKTPQELNEERIQREEWTPNIQAKPFKDVPEIRV